MAQLVKGVVAQFVGDMVALFSRGEFVGGYSGSVDKRCVGSSVEDMVAQLDRIRWLNWRGCGSSVSRGCHGSFGRVCGRSIGLECGGPVSSGGGGSLVSDVAAQL
jgi:hypothetical protein